MAGGLVGLLDDIAALAWALFWRVGIAAAFGFFIVNL